MHADHLTPDKSARPVRLQGTRAPTAAARTIPSRHLPAQDQPPVSIPMPGLSGFSRVAALAGATTGALATLMGAAGAHWVAVHASPVLLAGFQTATSFALWHALALLAVAWLGEATGASRCLRAAGLCWICGIPLFAGSLWLRGLGWLPGAAAVAPLGGSLLILGWVLCAAHLIRLPRRR